MIEPNFVDEIDCSSFFDHIDDLLDFPADDAATADASLPVAAAENYEAPAASFFPAEMTDALPASASAFPGDAAATDLSAELSVPYEDIVQLEWLSNFVEDSFSAGGSLTMKKVEPPSCTTNEFQFQISSPVSVLETTNSCSAANNTTAVPFSPEIYIPVPPCVRARSKRHRPAPSNNDVATSKASSLSDYDENNLTEHNNKKKTKRKSNKVANNPLAELDDDSDEKNEGGVMRKCMHCEISKTPQWRAGPMRPKTLCNACGVRYKSGRLFPEYRPAASPTFCPAVHSNSHKKVLEMRIKIGKGSSSGLAHTI